MKTNRCVFYRWLFRILLALSLSACASSDPFLAEDSTSVTGVGHIGRKVGIPEFYVNGNGAGVPPVGVAVAQRRAVSKYLNRHQANRQW